MKMSQLISVRDASAELGLTRQRVYQLIKRFNIELIQVTKNMTMFDRRYMEALKMRSDLRSERHKK